MRGLLGKKGLGNLLFVGDYAEKVEAGLCLPAQPLGSVPVALPHFDAQPSSVRAARAFLGATGPGDCSEPKFLLEMLFGWKLGGTAWAQDPCRPLTPSR